MLVVIAGGGRTGSTLAGTLISQGHDVRIVESRPDVLAFVHRELPTEIVVEGTPSNPEVLETAGIAMADVVAACTSDDADNLAICYVARERYKVGRTIACINNPRAAWLFGPTFHVDVALNQAQILASLIQEEMSLGDMMTLLKLRRGNYSLVEEKIPPGSPAIGVALQNLALPKEAVLAAVLRRGEILIPRGDLVFQEADEVLAFVGRGAAAELAAILGRAIPRAERR